MSTDHQDDPAARKLQLEIEVLELQKAKVGLESAKLSQDISPFRFWLPPTVLMTVAVAAGTLYLANRNNLFDAQNKYLDAKRERLTVDVDHLEVEKGALQGEIVAFGKQRERIEGELSRLENELRGSKEELAATADFFEALNSTGARIGLVAGSGGYELAFPLPTFAEGENAVVGRRAGQSVRHPNDVGGLHQERPQLARPEAKQGPPFPAQGVFWGTWDFPAKEKPQKLLDVIAKGKFVPIIRSSLLEHITHVSFSRGCALRVQDFATLATLKSLDWIALDATDNENASMSASLDGLGCLGPKLKGVSLRGRFDTGSLAKALAELKLCHTVQLNGSDIEPEVCSAIRAMPRLSYLTVNGGTLSPSLVEPELNVESLHVGIDIDLSQFGDVREPNLPNLKRFSMPNLASATWWNTVGRQFINGDLLTWVVKAPQLFYIQLGNVEITEKLCNELTAVPSDKEMKLDLVACKFTQPELKTSLEKRFGSRLVLADSEADYLKTAPPIVHP